MVLFVSDIHFGRSTPEAERAVERDLLACLRAHEDRLTHLYLLGDVFDAYIEYRHLAPKGFVRFLGLLAAWTDRGLPVTYLTGNHDPWHRDLFASELGVRVVFDALCEPCFGRTVYLAHGDAPAAGRLYRWLRPVLRHPVPVGLYRTLLPADLGMGLARWVKHHFGNTDIRPETVAALRAFARHTLQTTDADLVVLGHSHQAEHTAWPEGHYLNPGCWYADRTFGVLDEQGPRLLRWNGSCAVAFNPAPTA